MRAITVLSALAALSGAILIVGTAAAKGPFRAEISGGGLTSPVIIEGGIPVETAFGSDTVEAAPPKTFEPSYTVKLMPEQPDGLTGEYPVLMTLTYYPSVGDEPGVFRDDSGRHFEASPEFQAVLEDAIGAAKPSEAAAGDDGVSTVWYIAPSLVAVGLMLIGGLAGRRLLFRHVE